MQYQYHTTPVGVLRCAEKETSGTAREYSGNRNQWSRCTSTGRLIILIANWTVSEIWKVEKPTTLSRHSPGILGPDQVMDGTSCFHLELRQMGGVFLCDSVYTTTTVPLDFVPFMPMKQWSSDHCDHSRSVMLCHAAVKQDTCALGFPSVTNCTKLCSASRQMASWMTTDDHWTSVVLSAT